MASSTKSRVVHKPCHVHVSFNEISGLTKRASDAENSAAFLGFIYTSAFTESSFDGFATN